MSKSTDERGRLYLPKEVRERFGDRFRIVEFPSHVALFPVDDDPLDGVRTAVGEALAADESASSSDAAREAFGRSARKRSKRRGSNAGE